MILVKMDPKTKDYKALTKLVPLFLVLLVVLILLCPFNLLCCSGRYFFLVCLFHCICAPLYTVTLQDFFLADQLTSHVQAIRSLQFYVCYYGWGDYKLRQNTCTSGSCVRPGSCTSSRKHCVCSGSCTSKESLPQLPPYSREKVKVLI